MWSHLVNLLGHSWNAMVAATGTTTLGFIVWTLALTAVGWASTVGARWVELKREKSPAPLENAVRGSRLPGLFLASGVTALVLVSFSVFLVLTVYRDHQTLVKENATLISKNLNLGEDLEWRKHNVSTTDAVFPNLIYMLQAFESFKREMNGTPCVLYVSAPKETAQLASEIVQLAGPVSGCSPFGPTSADNPEMDNEVIDGMVPNAIVVHAVKGERAADGLFSTLGNQIHLERSYRLFRNPKERWSSPNQDKQHLIWLQFGNSVKWNSER